jgi:AraC-like DNA-binding protein
MVCVRCKMAVEAVLKETGISFHSVVLGRAILAAELTASQKVKLQNGLQHYGLELMEDQTKILVERIKTEIISLLHSEESLQLKLSVYLSRVLDYNYTYLANTFSEKEGITLEHYFIAQRVERAKELMLYENMSSAQVADVLEYSSPSHFSVQFKKITGMTPAEFKKLSQSDKFEWRPLSNNHRSADRE